MRILLLRHKYLTILAAILLAAGVFLAVTVPAAVSTAATERQLPIYCVKRDQKVCSVSFDAAWGDASTQSLVDILNKYNVHATFFVVGDWVDRYPESVKALADAGNEVMNHSNDHAHFSKLSGDEIVRNVNTCCDKIEAVTGVRPTLFRCPYGEYDDHVVESINGMGIHTIQWDVDSLDWKDYDAETIFNRVKDKVQPGSIVLFHNAALHTPEALPQIIEYLLAEGYTIVPVSELLLDGDYTIDHTGRQCPA